MIHSLEADLDLAMRLADAARATALERFRGTLQRRRKPDGSLVTDADEAVEDALRAMIAKERPGDAVLGEERGQTGAGTRRWIIDGIDGTHSFAEGATQWATLIALETSGRVVLGVCEQSPLDRRYWAVEDGGAFLADGASAPVRLRVSQTGDLSRARCFIQPPEWQRDDRSRAVAAALADASRPDASDDHPALLVASGRYDLAVFFAHGPWDVAAPSIVVREAGGHFTNLAGAVELDGGALFSNGRVHGAALEVAAR